MSHFLTLTISLVLLNSCGSSKLHGTYSDCNKHCFAYNKIIFKSDNSFTYYYFSDVGGEQILEGKWRADSDTIILNSNKQHEDNISQVLEYNDLSDSLRFKIINDYAEIILDSSKNTLSLKANEQFSIKNDRVRSFSILLPSDPLYKPIKYSVKNEHSNVFIISSVRTGITFYLKEKKYLFKNGRLFLVKEGYGFSKTIIT